MELLVEKSDVINPKVPTRTVVVSLFYNPERAYPYRVATQFGSRRFRTLLAAKKAYAKSVHHWASPGVAMDLARTSYWKQPDDPSRN